MPVYLFTLHSHGSWLPDRKQGYTRRHAGVFPADANMAGHYRDNMSTDIVRFNERAQPIIIDAISEKCAIKKWTCHGIATDATHVHVLLSWKTYTPWLDVRTGLKSSITRQLNEHHQRQKQWLADAGSRRRITNPKHFDHLLKTYLPTHRGLQWYLIS